MTRPCLRFALLACGFAPAACAPPPSLDPPPAYQLLPPDEAMSCAAIADSFRFAAVRAARLDYWLTAGHVGTHGLGQFDAEAPAKLKVELGRLDALSDLQRIKGCPVLDPVATFTAERRKLSATPPLSGMPAPSEGLRVRD